MGQKRLLIRSVVNLFMQQPFRFTVLLFVVIVSAYKQPGKTPIDLADESIASSNGLIDEYNKSIYKLLVRSYQYFGQTKRRHLVAEGWCRA